MHTILYSLSLALSLSITEKTLAPSSFLLPHQVFISIEKILMSFLFCRLNNPSSLTLSLYERCSDPLINFMASTALAPLFPCHYCPGESSTVCSTPDVSHRFWVEDKYHLPQPAGSILANAAVGLLCHEDTFLAHVQLLVYHPTF